MCILTSRAGEGDVYIRQLHCVDQGFLRPQLGTLMYPGLCPGRPPALLRPMLQVERPK